MVKLFHKRNSPSLETIECKSMEIMRKSLKLCVVHIFCHESLAYDYLIYSTINYLIAFDFDSVNIWHINSFISEVRNYNYIWCLS